MTHAKETVQMGIVALWITEKQTTLEALYQNYLAATGDVDTPFIAFADFMYTQCKHSAQWKRKARTEVINRLNTMT